MMDLSARINTFYQNLGAKPLSAPFALDSGSLTLLEYELPSGEVPEQTGIGLFAIHFALEGTTVLRRLVGRQWEEAQIPPGTATLSPPGHWKRAEWIGGQRRFSLYLSIERLCTLAGLHDGVPRSLRLAGTLAVADAALTFTMRALHAWNSESDRGTSKLAVQSLVAALSVDILHKHSSWPGCTDQPVRGGLAPWQLKRVKTVLAEELHRDVGLDELTALVNLSSTHLCTAFRQSTGLPPHQWQIHKRVERAKELLLHPKHSITDISLAVGYANPGHFATLFKRITGVSPRDWRRERMS